MIELHLCCSPHLVHPPLNFFEDTAWSLLVAALAEHYAICIGVGVLMNLGVVPTSQQLEELRILFRRPRIM